MKLPDVLGYAEELSLMALFGRNAAKTVEATLQKRPIRGCWVRERSRFGFFNLNPITYQTGSKAKYLKDIIGRCHHRATFD